MSVVKFPEQKRLVWTCAECHCSTFYLYDDHSTECASCGLTTPENGEWVTFLPPTPEGEVEKTDAGYSAIINFCSPEMARKRVVKKITDWGENTAGVFGIDKDGRTTSWYDVVTEEQKEWVLRKLNGIIDAIEQQKVDK